MPDSVDGSEPVDRSRLRLIEALAGTAEEDRAAFAEVYRLTARKLFGICLRICGTRQAAEDVLQEIYLTIWRRAGAYDPGRASPITWLATIARNRAIDWRRSHHLAPVEDDTALAFLPDLAPRPGDELIIEQEHRLLQGCLDTLDADCRDAIRTAFFGGLSYAELAEQRGVPLGTMKSRVRRSLLKLRECLGDD